MTMASSDGPIFGGRYQLSDRIAGGAMGDVWRATDVLLQRPVAVKILKRHYGDDATFRARFRLEAQAAGALSHPGIATVFDYGESIGPDGHHEAYLVMELVDGESLDQLLVRRGPLAPTETLRIISQVADALQAAHDRGIVHRDIKPANLLVRPDGRVKITDFGIARAGDGDTLTQAGTMLGTVQYMAPEQLSGQTATGASDLYALGVVAYVCLSGRTPFPRDQPMTVALAHLHEEVPALPTTVPRAVRDLVLQMLEKDPQRRPASAREVSTRATAVGAALHAAPAAAPTDATEPIGLPLEGSFTAVMPGPPPVLRRPALATLRRRRLGVVLAGLCAIVAVAVLLAVLLAGGPSSVAMPSVVGSAASAATRTLDSSGLHVQLHSVDSTRPAGTVVAQSPHAGVAVAPGSSVTLRVASGAVNVNPAPLVGQPYATAAARLSALGLVPTEVIVPSTAAAGTVVAVSPTGRVPLGTAVTVSVAAAPTPTTAPHRGGGDHAKGHKP
jgi:serine/threonine-protein kinase